MTTYHDGFRDPVHAVNYDRWSQMTTRRLKNVYESFNEIRMFSENQSAIVGTRFVEIGCATGDFHRYLRRYHPRFQYFGFDISKPAIDLAREKFPQATFFVCEEDLSDILQHCEGPSFVLCRDVVPHQIKPFDFLARLVELPNEAVSIRLRSRDTGESVLDPELSCQWSYDRWVPYLVLNIDQVIETIKASRNCSVIQVVKNYQPLGGHNRRFLPKDCYYPKTGTAETSVYVRFTDDSTGSPEVTVSEVADSNPRFSILDANLLGAAKRVFRKAAPIG